MRFYQHTMSTALADIRARDVWHIVMTWHFYVHTSVSSESLAEAVGSYFAVTRRRNINGILSMKHIVWSSKVRALGLKGLGEDGIMAHALNTHFQCSGPEGWHFHAKSAKQKTMTTVQMRNEVRLLSKPEWLPRYLGGPNNHEKNHDVQTATQTRSSIAGQAGQGPLAGAHTSSKAAEDRRNCRREVQPQSLG